MNSSFNTGTHHIFFPPRLEFVLGKDHSYRFSTDLIDYAALLRVLRQQSDCPARSSFRWWAAHQRYQCRLLRAVEHRLAADSRFFSKRMFQTRIQISTRDARHLSRIRAQG